MEGTPAPVAEPPAMNSPGTLSYHNPQLPPPPEGWTNVSEHMPNPAKFWQYLLRAILWRMLSFVVTYAVVGGFMVLAMPAMFRDPGQTLVIYGAILLISIVISLVRLSIRFRSDYRSTRIQVADQGVQRLATGYPPLVVRFAEVKKAQKFPRMLVLRTAQRERFIALSAVLSGYEEIVERVGAAVTLQEVRRPTIYLVGRAVLVLGLSAAVVGLYYVGLVVSSLWLEVVVTTVFAGLVGWSLWALIRSPHQRMLTKILTTVSLGMMVVILVTKIVVAHLLAR